jgi:uncharacterized protein
VTGTGETSATPLQATDPKLLELLVCPLTKTTLTYDAAAGELISRAAGLAYPIRHGVPLMTEDAARPLNDADYLKFGNRS